jgi:hypothetical protein
MNVYYIAIRYTYFGQNHHWSTCIESDDSTIAKNEGERIFSLIHTDDAAIIATTVELQYSR